jgi:hypothetical protein
MNNLGLSDERQQSRTTPEEGAVAVHFVWSLAKKRKLRNANSNQTAGENRTFGLALPTLLERQGRQRPRSIARERSTKPESGCRLLRE